MSVIGLDGKRFVIEIRKDTKGNLIWKLSRLLNNRVAAFVRG